MDATDKAQRSLSKLEGENKMYTLYVRVSARQRIILNNAARLDGRPLTSWVRRAALVRALEDTVV